VLLLLLLLLQNHNMMLLDEPTNHLDIEAIDSLAEAIKAFKVRGLLDLQQNQQ
jgi:ATP-binding cassette subfamily F protein 2